MIYGNLIYHYSIIGVGTTNFRNVEKKWRAGKKIAIQKGNLYKGTPYITVIGDGGWVKRS